MPKRKKKMPNSTEVDAKTSDLPARIKNITDGLFYTSEIDAEIAPFIGREGKTVDSREVLNQSGNDLDAIIREKDFSQFFAKLTEIQDWFEAEEKAAAAKFYQLKTLLENNLKDLKCFAVGQTQIEIYVVGLDAKNILTGIKTKAVET